ncbi:hypothetical protein FALCPG4_010278 [Fusarium falciforme]
MAWPWIQTFYKSVTRGEQDRVGSRKRPRNETQRSSLSQSNPSSLYQSHLTSRRPVPKGQTPTPGGSESARKPPMHWPSHARVPPAGPRARVRRGAKRSR